MQPAIDIENHIETNSIILLSINKSLDNPFLPSFCFFYQPKTKVLKVSAVINNASVTINNSVSSNLLLGSLILYLVH